MIGAHSMDYDVQFRKHLGRVLVSVVVLSGVTVVVGYSRWVVLTPKAYEPKTTNGDTLRERLHMREQLQGIDWTKSFRAVSHTRNDSIRAIENTLGPVRESV
jgi:hypothetical protein